MRLTIEEIAGAVGAKNDWRQWAGLTISQVEFDSRRAQAGTLLVPLEGGARDGHEFAAQGIAQGASLVFWSETTAVPQPDETPFLLVPDTLVAFQRLAQYYLAQVGAKVIAITGSNGKTTTKDLVASVLGVKYQTYKTQGNYNNQIGLPYTILAMPATTEMLVLEMGMDRFHEIDFLSQLATPDVAAITMIGESHLEHLGSRAGIAQAKMEITAGLKAEGLLVVPANEPLLSPLLATVTQPILFFGPGANSHLQAEIVAEDQESTSFRVASTTEPVITLPLIGHYNVANALIAIAIGRYFELSAAEIATGLAQPQLTQSRTEWLTSRHGGKILSDVYNANPTAMGLVLDTFSQLETAGKKIAVLADMKELGPTSQVLHESMAEHLKPAEIERVYLYGSEMAALYRQLLPRYGEENVHHYAVEERAALLAAIEAAFAPEDLMVLKGSNSMKLIELVEKVRENC